jgi:membrane protease YdiL (CAAX protease family)
VSATAREVRTDRGVRAWLLASTGVLLLVSRAVTRPGIPLLLLMFGAIGLASLTVDVPTERPRVHPVAVLAIGIGAVWVAGLAAGTPLPAPSGAVLVPLAMSTLAALAEEAFFRRFLYGRIMPRLGAGAAVVLTALLFAAIHVPIYGASVFWVDLGAGLLFGWQRWASGSWTAPAATHAFANLLVILR